MNVDDMEPDVVGYIAEAGGALEAMWRRQTMLMMRYDEIEAKNGFPVAPFTNLDDPKVQLRIKEYMWRTVEELGEAANELHNKPWKTTPTPTDKTHFKEEIVDAWHFFLEMVIYSGFTMEEFVTFYLKKSEVNKFRQRTDY